MHEISLTQARIHLASARWSQGRAVLTRVLRRDPRHPDACSLMAVALANEGQREQALHYAAIAAAGGSSDPMVLYAVGQAYLLLGRAEQAAQALRRAFSLAPNNTDVAVALAKALSRNHTPAEAARVLRPLAAGGAPAPAVLSALAAALLASGRAEEAAAAVRRMAALEPDNLDYAAQLAITLVFAPGVGPAEQREAFARYGRLLTDGMTPHDDPPPRRPGSKIRVGLLSPDLRAHPLTYFAEPIFDYLDRERFFVAAYMVGPEDGTSARLRGKTDLWRSMEGVGATEVSHRVRADAIDVLIDMAGHTAGHRIPALALRPARVHATMIGFASTTGVPGVGLRFVDGITDPPGSEAHNTERLVRLDPCFLCYRPPDSVPAVKPRDPGAPLTFVSFSNPTKLNEGLFKLWAAVLRAVPGSRLRIRYYGLDEPDLRDDMRARFAAYGVEPGRIEPEGPSAGARELLPHYHDADIALDTFPYTGTTTTCEALLMGVPVVTLGGETSGSRVGSSILTAAGLPELCTRTPDEYVRTAAALAADAPRRAELRATLRERFVRSPACDGRAYARRFGEALAAAVEAAERQVRPR